MSLEGELVFKNKSLAYRIIHCQMFLNWRLVYTLKYSTAVKEINVEIMYGYEMTSKIFLNKKSWRIVYEYIVVYVEKYKRSEHTYVFVLT